MAMPRRIPIKTITITISMKVKPEEDSTLPLTVFRSIESHGTRLGEHIVDVLASPDAGVGLVLIGAHSPFGGIGHRVDGNPAQELQLLPRRSHLAHPRNQILQLLGIALASELDVGPADEPHVHR